MRKNDLNLEMLHRAKKRIPGVTQLLSKRPDQFAPGIWPTYFQKAHGAEVWDLDGNRFVDMSIGGIGANVLGYCDPDVDQAVIKAISSGTSCSLNCPEEIELADVLCRLHPWGHMVRYARTGGEAMAIAVRIARAYTGKVKVAFCGYHGWHDWYLAANLFEKTALNEHLLSGLSTKGVPDCLKGTAFPFRYNNLIDLEKIVAVHGKELAAIIMEPIRNFQPEPGFLEAVKNYAEACGAVFIFDEISAAFRMNTGGAHILLGVEPDLAVFSKALGNGYPIAALVGKGHVMDIAQETFISSTYWTERIGPVAALATIAKHEKLDVGAHLMKIGSMVQEGWRTHADRHGLKIEIGGIAPLSHFVFQVDNSLAVKSYFVQLMLDKGFLASTSFYAMYAHTAQHVEQYLEAIDSSFADIVETMEQGSIEERMHGKPAQSGFKRLS